MRRNQANYNYHFISTDMAATLKELIIKGGSIYITGNATTSNKNKFETIGSSFSTIGGFKFAPIDTFNSFTTVEGQKCFSPLTSREEDALRKLQQALEPSMSIEENLIVILTKDFIQKQKLTINNMTLEGLNANPLLCRALKLNTPEEFVKFYMYSAISRSIVTSMGYLVQDLMLYSNANVYDGKLYETSYGTKWDVVIEKLDGVRSYIEVKSGPNDMDKTQILSYEKAINKVRRNGEEAFLGITYGKKDGVYVSTSILETYVKDWRNKTLIGAELWDYISDNNNYHMILMNTIQSTAEAFLGTASLIEEIDDKIELLLDDFRREYGTMDNFYNSLW